MISSVETGESEALRCEHSSNKAVMTVIDRLDIWPSDEAHTVNALAAGGDEGRWSLRKVSGRWQPTFDPGMSEWGNPPGVSQVPCTEYIGVRGERGELKHLSTLRNRNQLRFPQ